MEVVVFDAKAEVEVWIDDDDGGGWYEATVVQRQRKRYKLLPVSSSSSPEKLRSVPTDSVRPRCSRLTPATSYTLGHLVEALHNGAWRPGVVSAAVQPERYKVSFPTSRVSAEFKIEQMRPSAQWCPQGGQEGEGEGEGEGAMFGAGDQVEVYYVSTWFPGTIIEIISKTIFLVEYNKPKLDDRDSSLDLFREFLDARHIRPVPPRPPVAKPFKVHDKIEVCRCGGWTAGLVSKIIEYGSKYVVKLKYGTEEEKEVELHHSEMWILRNWTKGRWITATKQRGQQSFTGKIPDQPIRVSTSTTSRDNDQFTRKIYKRKKGGGSGCEGQGESLQPCTDIKKGETSNQFCMVLNCKKQVEWSINPRPNKEGRAHQRKQGHQFGTSFHAPQAPWDEVMLSEEAAIDIEDSLDNNVRSPQTNKQVEKLESRLFTPQMMSYARDYTLADHHSVPKLLTSVSSSFITGVQEISNFVNGPNDTGIDLGNAPLLLPFKESCASVRSNSVDHMVQEISSVRNKIDAAVNAAENMLHQSEGNASIHTENTSNIMSSKRVSVEEAAAINPAPTRSTSMKTLSFVKTSSLWESIESMEAFRIMPQEPHFRPLEQYCRYFREGMAIGFMVIFANLVAKVQKLDKFDSHVTIEEILKTLVPLEDNGFDVQRMRSRVENLLEVRNIQKELENKKATLQQQIFEEENEKGRLDASQAALDKTIEDTKQELAILRESRNSDVMELTNIESEIAKLQKDVEKIRDACLFYEQCFDRICASPW